MGRRSQQHHTPRPLHNPTPGHGRQRRGMNPILILALLGIVVLGSVGYWAWPRTKPPAHRPAEPPKASGTKPSEPVKQPAHQPPDEAPPNLGTGPNTEGGHAKDPGGDPPGERDWLALCLSALGAFAGGFLGMWAVAKLTGTAARASGTVEKTSEGPVVYGSVAGGGQPKDEVIEAIRHLDKRLSALDEYKGKLSVIVASTHSVQTWIENRQGEFEILREDRGRLLRQLEDATRKASKAEEGTEAANQKARHTEEQLRLAQQSMADLKSDLRRRDDELQRLKEELGAADLTTLVIHVADTGQRPSVPHPEALKALSELGTAVIEGRFPGSESELGALDRYVYALPRELALTMHGGDLTDREVRQVVMLQHQIAQHLKSKGLALIGPKSGDVYDRDRHEYSEDELVPHSDRNMDGRVHDTKRLGYELQGRVLRRALVRRYIAR